MFKDYIIIEKNNDIEGGYNSEVYIDIPTMYSDPYYIINRYTNNIDNNIYIKNNSIFIIFLCYFITIVLLLSIINVL